MIKIWTLIFTPKSEIAPLTFTFSPSTYVCRSANASSIVLTRIWHVWAYVWWLIWSTIMYFWYKWILIPSENITIDKDKYLSITFAKSTCFWAPHTVISRRLVTIISRWCTIVSVPIKAPYETIRYSFWRLKVCFNIWFSWSGQEKLRYLFSMRKI